MKHKVIDNFLNQEEFNKIRNIMTDNSFPWFFRNKYYEEIGQVEAMSEDVEFNELDKFQFIHGFYDGKCWQRIKNEIELILK